MLLAVSRQLLCVVSSNAAAASFWAVAGVGATCVGNMALAGVRVLDLGNSWIVSAFPGIGVKSKQILVTLYNCGQCLLVLTMLNNHVMMSRHLSISFLGLKVNTMNMTSFGCKAL